MKIFEIVDMNVNFKPFVFRLLFIFFLGCLSAVLIPYLNHFVLLPYLNYEIEKYMVVGMWAAGLGIYIGMCIQKSQSFTGVMQK